MSDIQRTGQRAYNDLYQTHPGIAAQICDTEADPFYDDSKLGAFYAKVAELKAQEST